MFAVLRVAVRLASVAAAAIGIQHFCVAPYRCNVRVAAIEARSLRAAELGASSASETIARGNLDRLAALRDSCHNDLRWMMLYAANCRLIDRRQEAVDQYTRALALNQRPELYYNRGMTLLEMGRLDDAVRDLAIASAFHPWILDGIDDATRARVEQARPR